MSSDDRSIDALGIKPLGEAVKIATQAVADGAAAFLGRICLPAAEEYGLLLRDKVQSWRASNAASMMNTAEILIGDANVHAHPRLVSRVLEEASWIDDQYLKDLWAGLLASSCTEEGDDDSNLMFLDLLSKLTRVQSLLLRWIVEKAPKFVTSNGLPIARELKIQMSTLIDVSECSDIDRLDREIDHLRTLGLIEGGFNIERGVDDNVFVGDGSAEVAPTAIALHMYVRCQGSRKSPIEYFQIPVDSKPDATGDSA